MSAAAPARWALPTWKWPSPDGFVDWLRERLVLATSDRFFLPLVRDVWTWTSRVWPAWHASFGWCVAAAKRVVHYAYDMFTGHMLVGRISDDLEKAEALWSYQSESEGITFVDLFMAMMAADSSNATADHYEMDLAAKKVHAESDSAESWTSVVVNADILSTLLRTAACLSGCIMQLNLEVVTRATRMPPKFTGFVRNPDKKGHQHTVHVAWNNYLFDLAAMWMLIARFREAFRAVDVNGVHHAVHKAHLWSVTGALASSAEGLKRFEPHVSSVLDDIVKCACMMHWCYLRSRDLSRTVLNPKAHASKDTVKKWVERLSASTYASWGPDVKVDKPDVAGTATLVDNMFAYSMVTALQAGIQNSDGDLLIGSTGHDLKYSGFMSEISVKITQSDAHMWAAVSSTRAWANNLEKLLPPIEDVRERAVKFSAPWMPSLEDLSDGLDEFKKTYWASKAKNDRDEIETIMASLHA
jgi:hypothetical protein